jgi:hypothetical protein
MHTEQGIHSKCVKRTTAFTDDRETVRDTPGGAISKNSVMVVGP